MLGYLNNLLQTLSIRHYSLINDCYAFLNFLHGVNNMFIERLIES